MQLIMYLSGIKKKLGIVHDQYYTVVFRIVQPRDFTVRNPVKEWRCRMSDLRGDINRLANSAQANLSGEASCTAGGHCKHCNSLYGCTTAWEYGIGVFNALGSPLPLDMTGEQLAAMYSWVTRAYDHIGKLRDAIETQVKSTLQSGGTVPGYGLTRLTGRLKWTFPVEDVMALGEAFGINLSKPDVITPTQAINAGLDKDLVSAHSARAQGGLKITAENDTHAAKAFKKQEN